MKRSTKPGGRKYYSPMSIDWASWNAESSGFLQVPKSTDSCCWYWPVRAFGMGGGEKVLAIACCSC